jgi:hypothetical protein
MYAHASVTVGGTTVSAALPWRSGNTTRSPFGRWR